jgi:hypothetical protein
MKPAPPPEVPGNTDWERFDNAISMAFSVPKSAYLKEEKRLRKSRAKKRAKKRSV